MAAFQTLVGRLLDLFGRRWFFIGGSALSLIGAIVCAISAIVYYAFSIVWRQLVFGIYTSDEEYGGWLDCLVGAGTKMGQLTSGLFARHIGARVAGCLGGETREKMLTAEFKDFVVF